MAMLLGVPNSSYVNLTDLAGYGYTFSTNYDKQDIRTKGGKLFTYITPSSTFKEFKIPTTFATSATVSQISSWFSTGTDLRFIEDDTFANSYYKVRIIGKTEPYEKFIQPYFRQFYSGQIILQTYEL
jgi:hypothetical protein